MSARELIVLGTSSQVPTRFRNHNGYFLRWDDEGILFDPGEGTQRQMIFAEVTVTQVTKICITHFHGDHCLGLAGLHQRISLDRVPHEIEVYFPASGQVYYERLRHAAIYHNVGKVIPRPIRQEGVVCKTDKFQIRALRLDHGVETFGYRLEEHDGRTMLPERLEAAGVRGPAIKQLIRQGELEVKGRVVRLEEVSVFKKGQVFAFVMDTRLCENCFELAKGADLLVCEATYLSDEEREARMHGHMTARQAGRLAREAKARKLVLTHFSQRYTSVKPFIEEAQAEFDGEVIAVRDGDRVPVPKRQGLPQEQEPQEVPKGLDAGSQSLPFFGEGK
ncbi:MAG: ribonuclease Z [Deltaproteobacteria bacterium]|nr:ribonuclease Z [Deltaproteobacteria bacterium]